jgi:hypothetical protein
MISCTTQASAAPIYEGPVGRRRRIDGGSNIILLMLKYGLLMCWRPAGTILGPVDTKIYVVPALVA